MYERWCSVGANYDRTSPTPATWRRDRASSDVIETSGPVFQAVDFATLDKWLYIEDPEQEPLMDLVVKSATTYTENITNHLYGQRTIREYLGQFPPGVRPIQLARLPVITTPTPPVVSYRDASGATQTMDAADVQVYAGSKTRRPQIGLALDARWPSDVLHDRYPDNVWIDYTAGYADQASIPSDMITELMLLVGHWWGNREAYAPDGRSPTLIPDGWASLVANRRVMISGGAW